MYSSLIGKARNVTVELYLRTSNRRLARRIIEINEVFAEVMVFVKEPGGEFASSRAEFLAAEAGEAGWREDRVLVNIADISIIA